MLLRGLLATTILITQPPLSTAAEQGTGIMRRVSCTVVRYYVAKYSEAAAEEWARRHGASDAEVEAARHCLTDQPAETVQAARWQARNREDR